MITIEQIKECLLNTDKKQGFGRLYKIDDEGERCYCALGVIAEELLSDKIEIDLHWELYVPHNYIDTDTQDKIINMNDSEKLTFKQIAERL